MNKQISMIFAVVVGLAFGASAFAEHHKGGNHKTTEKEYGKTKKMHAKADKSKTADAAKPATGNTPVTSPTTPAATDRTGSGGETTPTETN